MKTQQTMMGWVGGFSAAVLLTAASANGQTYRLASNGAIEGFEKVVLTDGSTIFVDATEATGVTSCFGNAGTHDHACIASALSLDRSRSARLVSRMQRTGANLIATIRGHAVSQVAEIDAVGMDTVTLRHARQVQPVAGTSVTVVTLTPRSKTVIPGEDVVVDVFISSVDPLRTFQVAVEAHGGASGTLERVEASIERERPDYVFAGIQAIDAADQNHGRLGATTFGVSVDASGTRYAGSFVFLASPDASGTFRVSVRPQLSFFTNDQAQDMPYRTLAAEVRVAVTKTIRAIR